MTLLVLWMLFCLGHVFCEEYTVNDTLFYNVTGTINTRVKHARDILDTESLSYQEIAGNLTRGFLKLFPTMRIFDYNITIMEAFLWPSSYEIETDKKQNFSFALIVRYAFFTAPENILRAEGFVKTKFWREELKVEGSEIQDGTLDIQQIPKEEVNNTIRILNNYMAFITTLADGESDTKPSNREAHGVILIVAYVGITLSVAGLSITVFSICYFRRLRRFRGNQILVHICLTVMAGMILSVVAFLRKGEKMCTGISILLHYFILAALLWMCVEAHNLYRDLVKVFNNILSTRVFFTRACLFAYGIPAVIVSVVAFADIQVYGERNDACWMTSLAFFVSFLVPVLLIVTVNAVFFVLIMREIIQVSQRDAHNIKPSLRAAISLSVVLGFCWLLAGISTFYSNPFFRYAFVVMSSFQGLFIFIFHGIGKQELRDSWKSLAIFKWQSHMLRSSAESNGRAKTESTQDALQPSSKMNTVCLQIGTKSQAADVILSTPKF